MDDERRRDERLSDAKMRYQVDVYYRTINTMVNELEARIEGLEEISGTFVLIQSECLYIRNTSGDEFRSSADKIAMRFLGEFSTELINFKTLYFSDNDNCPRTVLGYLEYSGHIVTYFQKWKCCADFSLRYQSVTLNEFRAKS